MVPEQSPVRTMFTGIDAFLETRAGASDWL